MATKFQREDGGYDKKVYESGEKCSGYLMENVGQDKKKFGNMGNKVTDNLPKPTDKGQGVIKPSSKAHVEP